MEVDILHHLNNRLEEVEKKMTSDTESKRSLLDAVHPDQRAAAQNFIRYLSLRTMDIRRLQDELHVNGLSSLASSESHILRQLQSIRQRIDHTYAPEHPDNCTYAFSRKQIAHKSRLLFGEKANAAVPFIMVTFDASFADDYRVCKQLLESGMNVARINCAHDDETTWSKMIGLLKKASAATGINCRIYMDLAGPKIRTQLLKKGGKKGKVKVSEGQVIWLAYDPEGFENEDIVISPSEPGIIGYLKKGERVYIDDGIIKCVIDKVEKNRVGLRIVRISSKGHSIKSDKGINFPDSQISISPLTDFDKACLPFICQNADMIGYSFVRSAADLKKLQEELKKLSSTPPYIIIKIETPEGVINLPQLLLQGMQQSIVGVMIARGDLAVEIGFERMGEIQEEILWICEAAHVPVIWATQVLESLNKSGIASRSEITDAAHAALAECILINKGKHTVKVIETLTNILQRIGGHHIKKRFTFRPLHIATHFFDRKNDSQVFEKLSG
jgi:pyruvate kinase